MTPDELFDDFVDTLRAVEPSARILIAFSGGLDSSVLVDLFDRARYRGGPQVELIHVDHGLRDSSRRDARFCTGVAARRNLRASVRSLHFPDRAAGQAQARQRRLATIAEHAVSRGIDDIAFGHHGDDRIETLLLNLRRGTGLDGLAPMQKVDDFPLAETNLRALRPLADYSRDQLEAYAAARRLDWIEDPTNATDDYARNRIRHHLVPRLIDEPTDRQKALNTIDHLQDERRAADVHCADLAERAALEIPGIRNRAFELSLLKQAPRATVARLFRSLERSLDASSLHRIQQAIDAEQTTRPRHLTLSNCVVTLVRDRVVFRPSEKRGAKDVLQPRAHPICIEPFAGGEAPFFHSGLRWVQADQGDADSSASVADRWSAHFDAQQLVRPLHIAGFIPGSRLLRQREDRTTYHQKLTTLFSEYRIDADIRWRWPCLFDGGDQLLWAAGLPRGAIARCGPDTSSVWKIELLPSDELTEIIQI